MTQKITTIEELADLITRNHESTNAKIDKGFLNVEEKFINLTETVLDSFDKVYADIAAEIKLVNIKMDNNFAQVNTKFEDLTSITVKGFDQVYKELDVSKKVNTLETKVEVITNKLGLQF